MKNIRMFCLAGMCIGFVTPLVNCTTGVDLTNDTSGADGDESLLDLIDTGGTVTTGAGTANGIYELAGFGGVQGTFVLDTGSDTFICIAGGGGETIGAPGNFLMVMVGKDPINRARYDTVLINGVDKNRVQFTGHAVTFTINNGVESAPGFEEEDSAGFDELTDCTWTVEAIDDDEGGDRWRTTIYDAEIWPDGTQFTNVDGDMLSGTVNAVQGGQVSVEIDDAE